jgi:FG-GAP repeat
MTQHPTISIAIVSFLLSSVAAAQGTWTQEARLSAGSGAGPFDAFGFVGTDGATVVVGAPEDNAGAGSAHTYVRNGSTWQGVPLSFAPNPGDWFGYRVAVSGSTIVVGAPYTDVGANTDAGAAYVFELVQGAWTFQAQLTAGAFVEADAQFGSSVAVRADVIVVGAIGADDGGLVDTGAAYVFRRNGSTWPSDGPPLFAFPLADEGSDFGASVAIENTRIVVGAPTYDPLGGDMDQGAAFVFVRSAMAWAPEERLLANDAQVGDYLGWPVAISGDTVVVGAPEDDLPGAVDDAGSAYVFTRSGSAWTQQAHLVRCGAQSGQEFGQAVACIGDLVAVSSVEDPPGAGSVQLFHRVGANWSEVLDLTSDDIAPGDAFGASIALASDLLVVGAPYDDNASGVDAGSAYVFRLASFANPFCFGDGSGAPCPCANNGCPGAGCVHSGGVGATLGAAGSNSVLADDVALHASRLSPITASILFAGDAIGSNPGASFGDGLKCARGMTRRFGARMSDAGGAAAWGPGLNALGAWSAGSTRYFQTWFHDASGPCGTSFNFTNAVAITFAP